MDSAVVGVSFVSGGGGVEVEVEVEGGDEVIHSGRCFRRTHWFALSTKARDSNAMVRIRGSQVERASACEEINEDDYHD